MIGKYFSALALAGFVALVGAVAPLHAAEVDTSIEALQARIAELESEVELLKTELAEARGEVESVQSELNLTRSLFLGTEGEDVEDLQEWLAQFDDVYPEGIVTGYFGPLTEKAVKRFQKKYGIEQVGVVGPQTRARIRATIVGGTIDDLPPGLAKRIDVVSGDDDDDDDDDDDSDVYTVNTRGQVQVCHRGKTLSLAIPALHAHLRHGDTGGPCDGDETSDDDDDDGEEDENETAAEEAIDDATDAIESAEDAIEQADEDGEDTTDAEELLDDAKEKLTEAEEAFGEDDFEDAETLAEEATELAEDAEAALPEDEVDETAPEISSIVATSTTAASTTITWDTDEDANSTVWYSTDTGFDVDDAGVEEVTDADFVQEHSVVLEGLDPETTYYFIVGSEDEAENEASSEEQNFTTTT